ncbi:type II toxin-antitoxin system HicB family antitoxin [Geomonas sp. Red32]|uniref:type II toxin-antitoxin system HicB family antitoxin n=1 Tax=Geomonas sp. Red32 TaxID=2912856 RepID=UPI00202CF859|nr:type II toxin-antitoxin system HicB family antitoxin [Geomonas sp. Red32]MCM0083529.1 type II toxin-antitoxin system HicB family antitoxin [Geomonas sp. Red32]
MSIKKIKPVPPPHAFEEYMHEVSPLSVEDGGGFLITFPDLPGCMSDGATVEEAVANGRDAFSSWVAAAVDMGRPIPKPTARPVELAQVSGKFVARLPKSMHARLVSMAQQEGVSLNTLVLTLIAESMGRTRDDFDRVLAKVKDRTPLPGDEI